MKNLLILCSFLITSSLSFAQCCYEKNSLSLMISGGGEQYGGYNFQFYGEETDMFLDSILFKLPESKRKNYTWKFKDIKVEGIAGNLSFEIHRGLKGKGENGRSYFRTFKNEKNKESLLSIKNDLEVPGILIYVRNGRKNALKSEEEARIVEKYLLSLKG